MLAAENSVCTTPCAHAGGVPPPALAPAGSSSGGGAGFPVAAGATGGAQLPHLGESYVISPPAQASLLPSLTRYLLQRVDHISNDVDVLALQSHVSMNSTQVPGY
jgi:hypothetical protein